MKILYWVRYIAVVHTRRADPATVDGWIEEDEQHDGEMGVTRDQPITAFEDIPAVAGAVGRAFLQQSGLPPAALVGIRVLSWQRFEGGALVQVPAGIDAKRILAS